MRVRERHTREGGENALGPLHGLPQLSVLSSERTGTMRGAHACSANTVRTPHPMETPYPRIWILVRTLKRRTVLARSLARADL